MSSGSILHYTNYLGGGGALPDFFFLFFFPCSADHERDWPPCKVVFFGLATNALNVRNNNNNILQNNCSTCHLPQKHTMYQCRKFRFEIGANVGKIRTPTCVAKCAALFCIQKRVFTNFHGLCPHIIKPQNRCPGTSKICR